MSLFVDYQSLARGAGDIGRRFGRRPLRHCKSTEMYSKITKIRSRKWWVLGSSPTRRIVVFCSRAPTGSLFYKDI